MTSHAGRSLAVLTVILLLAAVRPAAAQFSDTEVSGPGSSQPFLLGRPTWTWESLSGVTYTLYESTTPSSGYASIQDGLVPNSWDADRSFLGTGGGGTVRDLRFYLVTANDGTADNRPGSGVDPSGGDLPRDVTLPPRCFGGAAPVQGRIGLKLTRVGTFSEPLFLTSAPGVPDRVYVMERAGRIQVLHLDGTVNPAPFLDITDRVYVGPQYNERGLLGLAFHPDSQRNDLFYVHYSISAAACGSSQDNCGIIAEFQRVNDDSADPASERELLRVEQPFNNHNGGWLGFGPNDGMLYIGLGDGGSGGDPRGNGQNRMTLLGSLLRIDPLSGGTDPYGIPPDNPFNGSLSSANEIWSWGLRNPWRDSFDRETGDLYIADVGQNTWEEVDVSPVSAGAGRAINYGWNIMEGSHCYQAPTCDQTGLTLPDYEYSHAEGCSITGGYVYRGCRMPGWSGVYLFGDYCDGWIRSFVYDGGAATQVQEVLPPASAASIVSFGEDAAGEIYVLDRNGPIYRLDPDL